ncbi:MAG: sensor histidine kinase [Oscillospiraceae bacterium]|nr:sensor histidine kinase [Oscillospiraceae bacterium]
MDDKLITLFGACAEAVICEKDGRVTFLNTAAKRHFPASAPGDALTSVFPDELSEAPGPCAFSADIGGELCVSVCPLGEDGRAFVFPLPDAERSELEAFCAQLGRSLRENASVLLMAGDALAPQIEELGDPRLDAYTAMLWHNVYSVLHTASDVSFFGSAGGEAPAEPRQVFDIVRLCAELTDSVSRLAGGGLARVTFKSAVGEASVEGVPALLEEALLHLLSNSLKYTPADGAVAVSVVRRGGRVSVTVADTGCGIPDDVLGSVFRRYGSAHPLSDTKSGLGLGLTVVRHIAVRHGGSLMLSNGKNGGAVAVLTLPEAKKASRLNAESVAYGSSDLRPLLTFLSDVLPTERYTAKYLD